ncbi:baseplate J/gp47 family protein [Bradyrhizobium tropiciagri]|uniref:baseplate J/gp47 family protein n=1 Tax=Bradyrhizobium tropiciagri TaxID=312253 RepID=UPI001BA74B9D|nr:baseplate J/gp47 family protein [Bradyrhizobium tropiciagri]MBR0871208.1 baseplate J/gp47 family protein [Bradyrhizobium tropiciagri]
MFQIPSLADLLARARQAFRTYLPGSDAWVWPNNVYASAKVIAGMAFEVFGFASYISRMIFASTAPDIETLRLHGAEFGIPQLPAAPASGNVTFTATAEIAVDNGATLQRADGVTYLVTSGGVLPGAGTLVAKVTASVAGGLANAAEGTSLQIVSGVTGAGSGAALASVGDGDITQGADVEDIESYRQRILFRKRNPPHGGSAADYVIWARQMAGVSRVFVERLWSGAGTVRVFVFMDGLFPDGIPDATAAQRVEDYIQTVCPAGAIVTVSAPVAHPIDVTISNLVPNTVTVQEAILTELRAAFLRLGRVSGSDTQHGGMPFLATPASFSLSWIYQAIANASGVESFDLPLTADADLASGETATLGSVTFA